MGLDIEFIVTSNSGEGKVIECYELRKVYFLRRWCKNNLGLSDSDYKEGMFLSTIVKSDLIKLKEDCLNWLSNPEKYPEYVDIDDIECEFRDIADVLCIIWKLFNLSLKKFKIEIYLDW